MGYNKRFTTNQSNEGNVIYGISKSNLNTFLSELNDFDGLGSLFTDFSQYIVSLRAYPINFGLLPTIQQTENFIKVGTKTCESAKGVVFSTSETLQTFSTSLTYIDWVNDGGAPYRWLSLEPYASAQIYLPFHGYIDIDLSSIMGRWIQVQYCIDFLTGLCTTYVWSYGDDSVLSEDAFVAYQSSFQMGVDCPFSSDGEGLRQRVNTYTWIKDVLVEWPAKSLGGMTGGWMGAVSSGAQATENTIDTTLQNSPRLIRGGSYSGSWNRTIESFTPHIIIAHKDAPSSLGLGANSIFRFERGYKYIKPVTTISSFCSGFTKMIEVHLENIPTATKQELDEIEQLLMDGVRLKDHTEQ